MSKLSQTAKRSYLYLALVLIIVLLLMFWPSPKQTESVPVLDSVPSIDSVTPRQSHQYRGYAPSNSYSRNTSHTSYPQKVDSSYRQNYIPAPSRQHVVVDINTADTLTLQLVKGIGPTFANRIVNYRKRLGGFVSIAQLLEVYGLTAERVDAMAPYLTLSLDSISQIDINHVAIKQLVKHPYIDYYQARDIVAYRNKGHSFRSIDDLRLIPTIDDTTIARLSPYLCFK